MKIRTTGRVAAAAVLATIALIAAAIGWAHIEVQQADLQRRRAHDITQGLMQMQQVTFEYLMHRQQRAKVQQSEVSDRLAALLTDDRVFGEGAVQALAALRERVAMTRHVLKEVLNATAAGIDPSPSDEAVTRFEAQLTSQLLILQQESLGEAFRLTDFSTRRIAEAERRVVLVIAAGLTLIALNTLGAAWLIHHLVLNPIRRLEQATREVASGNWQFKLNPSRQDEIGELSRNFDAMTHSLQDSFAQVERSNRELAALNQEIESFSYSVSHDLRAPLRSMDGFSLALLEDYEGQLDAEGQDSLRRIRAACQRMGQLIDDLLGLARVTRAEITLRPVDLSEMARAIAHQLSQHHPTRSVEWIVEDQLVVMADKALMQIALQNLMENAWKFTGHTRQAIVRVGATRHGGGRLECFVADNGVGFDMAYSDRLFGAFQRLHHESEFPGTGIGLATVQRIFLRHAAKLWVKAQLGVGATFFFSLNEPSAAPKQTT